MEQVEAGLVGGEHRPGYGHATEWTDGQPAVGLPAPGATPVLELDDLAGRLRDEGLDGVLVGQIVTAPDGVEGVEVDAVVVPEGRPRPSLRRDRVAPHRVDLGDQGDAQAVGDRSEERRVGKECRSRWSP